MTSHLDSQTTTDVKPDMLSGVQTGNGIPHDRYNICGIAHACINRKHDIFMQRRLVKNFTSIMEWGQGTCSLTKHTLRWTYSALWHFFYIIWKLIIYMALILAVVLINYVSTSWSKNWFYVDIKSFFWFYAKKGHKIY